MGSYGSGYHYGGHGAQDVVERPRDGMVQMTPHTIRQSITAIFVLAPIVGWPLWMIMDRTPPLIYERVDIAPKEVRRGGEIVVTFTVRKNNRSACRPGLIYREFTEVASRKVHTTDPVIRAQFPIVDQNNQFSRTVQLSQSLSPGEMLYKGRACYSCNWIQEAVRWPICSDTPPATFTIVEKSNGGR